MKIVIVAGGTGGHLFPGLVIADTLRERNPDAEVAFIGRKNGLESEVIAERGFLYFSVSGAGIVGKSLWGSIFGAASSVAGFLKSFFILLTFRPDVVVGMGGYLCGPFLLAAYLLRFPTLIHEQNLRPGTTNRILSKFVNEIAVSFEESEPFFSSPRVIFTGNPVRKEILKVRGETPRQKDIVLIMGGSMGSHHLNMTMAEAANYLQRNMGSKKIVHLTGESDFSFMKRRYEEAELPAEVYVFSHRMEEFYSRASLVIARAGATTLAEITVAGLPSILIPYPHAGAHQLENARWLENKGGAVLVEDAELNAEKLTELILDLIQNEEKLAGMAKKTKESGMPQAAELVAERVEKLATRNSN